MIQINIFIDKKNSKCSIKLVRFIIGCKVRYSYGLQKSSPTYSIVVHGNSVIIVFISFFFVYRVQWLSVQLRNITSYHLLLHLRLPSHHNRNDFDNLLCSHIQTSLSLQSAELYVKVNTNTRIPSETFKIF